MARKGLGFKPTFKAQLRANARASRYYSLISVGAKPPPLEPEMPGVDIDAVHKKRAAPRQLEAPVVQAIGELLARHPMVLFAVRQNSGAASYEASTGRYAPVHFYRILTHGKEITLPDFWGIRKDGRIIAIEAKAPGWKEPRTEREFKQANFIALVKNANGYAGFARSVDEARAILDGY